MDNVQTSNPGSDVAGEMAAALAASLVFQKVDPTYSKLLLRTAKSVSVDYILGVNPMQMSYTVGYGTNYLKRIHHRGSLLPSVTSHPESVRCNGFQPFYFTSNANPNTLTGAIVGGPNQNNFFPDDWTDWSHSEPATCINGAVIGSSAYLSGS
ncbi:hypothetical protein LguiB_018312 [Lonicera macranthoides]